MVDARTFVINPQLNLESHYDNDDYQFKFSFDKSKGSWNTSTSGTCNTRKMWSPNEEPKYT